MADKTYNGWSNYETWAVKLWLDNDRAPYEEVTGHAADLYREAIDGADGNAGEAKETAASEMANYLKSYVDDLQDLTVGDHLAGSMFSGLLHAAISEVDWYEMGESYIGDAAQEYTPADSDKTFTEDDRGSWHEVANPPHYG